MIQGKNKEQIECPTKSCTCSGMQRFPWHAGISGESPPGSILCSTDVISVCIYKPFNQISLSTSLSVSSSFLRRSSICVVYFLANAFFLWSQAFLCGCT